MNDLVRILLVLAGVGANTFGVWAGVQAWGTGGAATDNAPSGAANMQTIDNDTVTAGGRGE